MNKLTDAELEGMRGHTKAPFKIEEDAFDGFKVYAPRAVRKPFTMYVIERVGGRMHGKSFDDDREVRANVQLFKNAPALLAEVIDRRARDAVVREALEKAEKSLESFPRSLGAEYSGMPEVRAALTTLQDLQP